MLLIEAFVVFYTNLSKLYKVFAVSLGAYYLPQLKLFAFMFMAFGSRPTTKGRNDHSYSDSYR